MVWRPRHTCGEDRGNSITVCAIVKDEARYLIEWVAYYRLLGFDRIVLYSNDSSDETDPLLDAMAAAGLIDHRRWPSRPGQPPQQSAYADAVAQCATRWILFVDADEFLHLAQDRSIGEFLARFDADVSAVAISWRLFGSNGHSDYDNALVVERFTRAAPVDHHLNRHVKTMAVAAAVDRLLGVHAVALKGGRYVMANGMDTVLQRDAFAKPKYRFAQINHYVVKSRVEFEAKKRRGIATLAPEERSESTLRDQVFFDYHDRNDEEDRAILTRLAELKAEVARVRQAVRRIDPTLQALSSGSPRWAHLRDRVRRASAWLRRQAKTRPAPA